MSKSFSQACENNKVPIAAIIGQYFHEGITVLEIGSYTTQHVQFFAASFPQVRWQPSDTPENLSIVSSGLEGNTLSNILPPVALDVSQPQWPLEKAGAVFSANTLHIMPEAFLENFFRGSGRLLEEGGYLCVYGPFKYGGEFTSDSNAGFEQWLKARDPDSGVRDFETVNALARDAGMDLVADHLMPANNQLLVWQKNSQGS